ncbi:S-adenosyl-L-methionine-dependent methyltransferase [Aspergillus pseudonomiae]|uniref:S-adenosyl-L-methionine-dependent methyltransferase n=1 Tax=Aspergillus pseudonomiae TaxID=1506151 RepID=A0A5N7DPR5_9EURO|nr:S-adenosyl-L-methionine-dependent methyltransferase [Aspergillus pseudonomiae]KAE8408442.1 S-adenosyl-L-methionine-dependent methyltransferase [Aspergillus pseudonomiae]
MSSQTAVFTGTEGSYLLPHHVTEADRLQRQHRHFTVASNHAYFGFPLPPPTGRPLRVLDSGCADGVWLHDMAKRYPEHSWDLHGVDIASHLFNDSVDIDFRYHDIRQPFPSDWQWDGSFDIIHQRLLVWALKKEEWPQVVRNLQALLKPGGTIQFVECQWLRPEYWDTHPQQRLLGLVQIWATEGNGMDIHLADKLEPLLEGLGFKDVTTVRYPLPYGAKVEDPANRDKSAELWVESFRHLARLMGGMFSFSTLRKCTLTEVDEGIPGVAKTPEEYFAFLDRLVVEMKEKGYVPELRMVSGRKE